jgi:transposase InsO family protein
MTEIDTGEGKLYLATVIDLFSRRLLGYAMGERHDAELVVASLNMAAATRGGDVRGVIMHTDRAANTAPGSSSGPAASWASCSRWAESDLASTTS